MLVNQLVTGILLACYYVSCIDFAFSSVDCLSRDINYGWLIRYMHSNGASFFFILIYMHISRALYYGTYRKPRHKVWISGILLFLLVMATAFLGYVLPWGQMSFWGATVITNFLSVIPYLGVLMTQWLWGGFVVGEVTITRFYLLHFLLPFVISVLSTLHILTIHMIEVGSSSPLLGNSKASIKFHPNFQLKDMFGVIFLTMVLSLIVYYYP